MKTSSVRRQLISGLVLYAFIGGMVSGATMFETGAALGGDIPLSFPAVPGVSRNAIEHAVCMTDIWGDPTDMWRC